MLADQGITVGLWVQIAAACLTGLAVLVAYIGIRRQTARARTAVGMDLLFRLLAAWDGQVMRATRARLANELIEVRPIDSASVSDPKLTRDAIDVLNSFEYLGFLVCTAKEITVREARKVLGPFAVAYWLSFHRVIVAAPEKEGNPATLDQFTHLLRLIIKEQRKSGQGRPLFLKHDIPRRLKNGLSLGADTCGRLAAFRANEEQLADSAGAGNLL